MKLQTNNYKLQTNSGLTLIELLLYVAISSVLLLVISFFLFTLLQSRIKNQTIAEVEQQGLQVVQVITQTARNATGINTPGDGTSGSSLSLGVIAGVNDPSVFDSSGGVIRIKEGAGSAVALTNSRVSVSSLTFQNLSRNNTLGTIRVQFTLTHINSAGRNEYSFSKTFTGSATLRQP